MHRNGFWISGLGGHCIPIDPFYLTGKAREYGLHTHFIELAGGDQQRHARLRSRQTGRGPHRLCAVAACLVLVVATNHDGFDYALIKQHAKLIVDTRGVYREASAHIVRA